jgi:hypothetical protein
MSDFDVRWQTCAERAQGVSRRDETAPFGFATRVVASGRPVPVPRLSLEMVWQRLTLGALGFIAVALVVCAAVEVPHFRDQKPLEPGIENTVAQVVWSL